ncbi:nucleoside monophosphate kinase [Candidatus Parcubacteria bacterium]|nr:nucleoside monophosphate kinase [Candidatus Parcubacteria bacterium]
MSLHTVIFIGRSGCGKGTQAGLLKDRIHRQDEGKSPILYVETGEHFRNFIRGTSFSSTLSQEIYGRDERQPDFLAGWMWANLLIQEMGPGMHIVFDGAPRAVSEAELLTTALTFYKRERPVVIHEERLLARGRSDDRTLAKIDKRLDWFDKDVLPAIEYFKRDPYYRFIEVDGEQTIEGVHRDIIAAYDYSA